jgi:hypothetical protein
MQRTRQIIEYIAVGKIVCVDLSPPHPRIGGQVALEDRAGQGVANSWPQD